MKVASLDMQSDFFGIHSTTSVADENDLLFTNDEFVTAKHIDGVLTMVQRVSDTTQEVINEGYLPFVLAGDHSTAAGTLIGIKQAYPNKRIGAIWIDAHADLHTPFTTPSGNMHGMPLAIVSGIDNAECKVNQPKEKTLKYWEEIKRVGTDAPKVDLADVVFVAVRDTEHPEKHLMDTHGIKNFTTEEVWRMGAEQVARQALEHLSHCDLIYVSFDVDSLDPRISSGTGTPVVNGLSVEEARLLNTTLVQDERLVGWEIVEVNPTLDTNNIMARNAFDILEASAKAYKARKTQPTP